MNINYNFQIKYVLIGTKIKMNFHSIPLPLKLHMLMQRLLIQLSIKGIEDMESYLQAAVIGDIRRSATEHFQLVQTA